MSTKSHITTSFLDLPEIPIGTHLFFDSKVTNEVKSDPSSQSKPDPQLPICPSIRSASPETHSAEKTKGQHAQMLIADHSYNKKSWYLYTHREAIEKELEATMSKNPGDNPHDLPKKFPPVRVFRGKNEFFISKSIRLLRQDGSENTIPDTPFTSQPVGSTIGDSQTIAKDNWASNVRQEVCIKVPPSQKRNELCYTSQELPSTPLHPSPEVSQCKPAHLILPPPPENLYKNGPRRATRTPKAQPTISNIITAPATLDNTPLVIQPTLENLKYNNNSLYGDFESPIGNKKQFRNIIQNNNPIQNGISLYDSIHENHKKINCKAPKDLIWHIPQIFPISQHKNTLENDQSNQFNHDTSPLHARHHPSYIEDLPPVLKLESPRNIISTHELHRRLFERSIDKNQTTKNTQGHLEHDGQLETSLTYSDNNNNNNNNNTIRDSTSSIPGIYSNDPNQLIAPTIQSRQTEEAYGANHQYWENKFAGILPLDTTKSKNQNEDIENNVDPLFKTSARSMENIINDPATHTSIREIARQIKLMEGMLPFKRQNKINPIKNQWRQNDKQNPYLADVYKQPPVAFVDPPIDPKEMFGCADSVKKRFAQVVTPRQLQDDCYDMNTIHLEGANHKEKNKDSTRTDPLQKAKMNFCENEVSPGAKRIDNIVNPPKPQKKTMNRNPVIYLKFKNRYNRCYHEHPWVNVGRIANVTDLRVEKPAKPTVEQRLKISMPLGKVQGESRFDNYIIRQDLGYGANGVVKEGLVPLNKPGTYLAIAIKTCRLDSSNTENNEYILREVAIMNRMRHKRIIKIYEVCLIGTQAKLAIELMACSIGRLISIMEPMKESMAMRIIRDALEGLAYLHSKNYIHRDVKCDNIMIDWGGVVKLGDFGLAIPFNKSKRGVAGTVRWMAPEVVGKEAYDSRADIWSLGISIIEMMDCLPPYGDEHENSKKIEERIIRGPTPFFTTFEPTTSMKHITNMMLTRSRLERPSAKELLRMINSLFDRRVYTYITSQNLADTVKKYILPKQKPIFKSFLFN